MKRIGVFVLLLSVGPGGVQIAEANIASQVESIRTQTVSLATEGGFAKAFDFLVKEGRGLPPPVVSQILGEAFVVGYATHTVVKGGAAIPFAVWQGKFKHYVGRSAAEQDLFALRETYRRWLEGAFVKLDGGSPKGLEYKRAGEYVAEVGKIEKKLKPGDKRYHAALKSQLVALAKQGGGRRTTAPQ